MNWIEKTFSKDKRRNEDELINIPFPLRLTRSEKEFVKAESDKEFTSENSIIRKALNQYRSNITSKSE